MKTALKTLLRAVAPRFYTALMAARTNRHGRRVLARHRVPEIAAAWTARHGAGVRGGPFAGMRYLENAIGSSLLPKLVGSYERELHGVLSAHVLATRYDTVVDVGSAEGFYAVGLARTLPGEPTVYAFDVDPAAQRLCRELAQRNGVAGRVVVAGACDARRLGATLRGRALVVCDCEGGELDLLDPAVAPALAASDLLVELHDHLRPGVTPTLRARFEATHRVDLIPTEGRDPADYPLLSFLPAADRETAVSEFRNGPQQWMFLTPRKPET